MKRFFLILGMCLIAASGLAQTATAPAYVGLIPSIFFRDINRNPVAVSPDNPLPMVGTMTVGSITVSPEAPLIVPDTGTINANPATSISIPANGFHLSLVLQNPGTVTVWYRVGTATVSVVGAGHEPLTYAADFDVAPSSVVGLISSVSTNITYRIDRR